jgi:hypothetical protein
MAGVLKEQMNTLTGNTSRGLIYISFVFMPDSGVMINMKYDQTVE